MAKKSQTNARRNNTQAGRRIVNFYNNGTVNFDARRNRSRTNKTENNGCTINYPFNPSRNMIGDYFPYPHQSHPATSNEVVVCPTPKKQKGRKSFSKKLKIVTGIVAATLVAGVSIAVIKHFN